MGIAFLLALLLLVLVGASAAYAYAHKPLRQKQPLPKFIVTSTCTRCGTERVDEVDGVELTKRAYAFPSRDGSGWIVRRDNPDLPAASDGFALCRHKGHVWGQPVRTRKGT